MGTVTIIDFNSDKGFPNNPISGVWYHDIITGHYYYWSASTTQFIDKGGNHPTKPPPM